MQFYESFDFNLRIILRNSWEGKMNTESFFFVDMRKKGILGSIKFRSLEEYKSINEMCLKQTSFENWVAAIELNTYT